MTLRARLTLALVAVVTVGLLGAGLATYTAYRSSLMQRVDEQLRASITPAALLLLAPQNPSGTTGPEQEGGLPAGTFVEAFDPGGQRVGREFALVYGDSPAIPDLPSTIGDGTTGTAPFSAGAVGGSGLRYRALAMRLTGGPVDGYTIVVAIPLTEVTQSLSRLGFVLASVTLVVLAMMAAITWWTVKRGLRPLERIEQTAGAIAAGDLSLRVDRVDPRTEVGRLGLAINVMLGRIEVAMDDRRASEQALRRFLADASHELRTPLTSIRGYAELFRRGADTDPSDTALAMRRIEQESARMGVLVDDLLFLARAGQGRPVSHDPVDLSQVAADAILDARTVDPTRPIDLIAKDALMVVGDEGRLRQVVANLLSNALTHTPQGTPVTVRLVAEGSWTSLDVADAGSGLSAEEAARVFDPFYRADAARSRLGGQAGDGAAGGAGLGLSIVAAIAEAHGGEAHVTSEPGLGSTFTVRIPDAAADPTEDAGLASPRDS